MMVQENGLGKILEKKKKKEHITIKVCRMSVHGDLHL